ncbi:UTP18 [Branchiostoma lanceolatum]|uniref:U3 small nucleolar RNA-associated protein 18 homolog n=1 Tax=Branchiostoma lanceolatum TaxID=7740 RepID=A0A8J9VP11_BRALA|nr:UTP18 [Branchiostoma lanceolatum]
MLRRAARRKDTTSQAKRQDTEDAEEHTEGPQKVLRTFQDKKTWKAARKAKEESALEELVLGIQRREEEPIDRLEDAEEQSEEGSDDDVDSLGVTDTREAPWVDDDDDSRTRVEKTSDIPSWAQTSRGRKREHESDDDSDEELLQHTGDLLAESSALPRGNINVKRCSDVNKTYPHQGPVRTVEFHPSAQVCLTAAQDVLGLFQIDGRNNPKIQTLHLQKFPIRTARFSTCGREVVLASATRWFFVYDMIAGKVIKIPKIRGVDNASLPRFEISPDGKFLLFLGKNGFMHLLSAKTKECVSSLKMNSDVSAATFSRDSRHLYSVGDAGEVYVWDVGTRDCIHKFVDDGCTHATTISLSHNSKYLATGSQSGVVNIYDAQHAAASSYPKPLKALLNLTTPVTQTCFNHSGEVMAMCSSEVFKAARLVHLPTLSVFSNFPEADSTVKCVQCLDFSPHSGYLAMGNNQGRALLYRIKHYKDF